MTTSPIGVSSASDPTVLASASGSGSATSGIGGATAGSSTLSQLANPQLFLKLLIAELQNQDPTNPMDPTTILTQTSALSQVEALTSMTSTLSGAQAAAQDSEADGLIGRTVTAQMNGTNVSGVVTTVNLSTSGEPTLSLQGATAPIPLSQVTQVS